MVGDDRRSTDPGPVFDPDAGAYRVRYEPSDPTSLVSTVIGTVAAIAGVPETALGDRLYDHVDPDALAVLFEPTAERRRPGSAGVWFTLAAHLVVVRAGGDIAIYPPEAASPELRFDPDPET